MPGIFITFEGGEAAGKSTIINEVTRYLKDLGKDVLATREPGGVDIAEQIRSIILRPENTLMDARTEALLYAASRMQHLKEKVIPALEAEKIVLCDRYLDSSLAYQGYGRMLGIEDVMLINKFATPYMPDLTFFIDVQPEIALKRINGTNRFMDRLDLEKIDFHNRVYLGYKKIEELYKNRFINIDGSKDLIQIIQEVKEKLNSFLTK